MPRWDCAGRRGKRTRRSMQDGARDCDTTRHHGRSEFLFLGRHSLSSRQSRSAALDDTQDSGHTGVSIDFAAVVEALPGLVLLTRSDGGSDFINRGWSEYTGLSLDQSRGQGWLTA